MPKTKSGITQKSPELKSLLTKIEEIINFPSPQTIADFREICTKLNDNLKGKKEEKRRNKEKDLGIIQERTALRLWDKEKYSSSFSYDTLNLLALIANYTNWGEYINASYPQDEKISPSILNPTFDDQKINDVEKDLTIGQIITLGWYPQRYAVVKYKGDCEFEIIEFKGRGRDLTGKTITARWFEVIKDENGYGTSMYTDIAGVLGDEIYERLYL